MEHVAPEAFWEQHSAPHAFWPNVQFVLMYVDLCSRSAAPPAPAARGRVDTIAIATRRAAQRCGR
eukprot:COSAG06_NODE_895_length_11669_cov_5.131384_1_plen_64_part_10